jgi:hypothetical protein
MILENTTGMLESLLKVLISRMALFIYAIILCVVVIFLAVAAMVSAKKNAHPVAEKVELSLPPSNAPEEKKGKD